MKKFKYTRNLPLKLKLDGFERIDKKWLPKHKEVWEKDGVKYQIDHIKKTAFKTEAVKK